MTPPTKRRMKMNAYDRGYAAGLHDFDLGRDTCHDGGHPKTAYQRGYAAGWKDAAEQESAEWAERDRRRALVEHRPIGAPH